MAPLLSAPLACAIIVFKTFLLFSNEFKSMYKNEINYIEQSMRRINFNDATTEQLK